MADNEKTTRGRGRPRKIVEDHPVEAEKAPETVVAVEPAEDENVTMQEQLKYQLTAMIRMAKKMGIDLDEIYETPPKETTVVLEQATEDVPVEAIVDSVGHKPVVSDRPKPGTVLPGGNWIPWRKDDLNPEDQVEFVPQPVPGLVFPMLDEEGHQKILLDVNDLKCWLTVGVPNKVNRYFKNVYDNCYDAWRELENFKRNGPIVAPWGRFGPDGRPAWHYEPMALTFGMDIDGRYLTANRSPLYQVREENEDAI